MSTADVYGPQLVLVTTGRFLDAEPSRVRGVILALTEAMAFLLSPRNADAYKAAFADAFGNTSSAAWEQARRDLERLNRRPLPSLERVQGIQRLMAGDQHDIGKLDLGGVIRDHIVSDLDRTGKIDEVFGRHGLTLTAPE